jgi:hypothetical protein
VNKIPTGLANGYAEGKGTLTWFINGKPHSTYQSEPKGGHYTPKARRFGRAVRV